MKSVVMSRSKFLAQAGMALAGLAGGWVIAAGETLAKSGSLSKPGAARGHNMKYSMVVFTNPRKGKDQQFVKWYVHHHFPDVLASPGFVRAQLFKVAVNPSPTGPHWQYYASYELQTDDPKGVVNALVQRYQSGKLQDSDTLDPANIFWAVYEAVSPMVSE